MFQLANQWHKPNTKAPNEMATTLVTTVLRLNKKSKEKC